MFEPVHGSAPDIAGQGKANPIAAILSARDDARLPRRGRRRGRIRKACADPETLTGTTAEIGDLIVARL